MKSVLFWGNQLLQFLVDKGWERGWIGGGDRRRWDIERLGLVVGQLLEGVVLLKELDQLLVNVKWRLLYHEFLDIGETDELAVPHKFIISELIEIGH